MNKLIFIESRELILQQQTQKKDEDPGNNCCVVRNMFYE